MELIEHFASVCGRRDQAKEELDGEALKRVVESVAFVKVEDGVKFVCLDREGSVGSVMRAGTGGHHHEECNGNIHEMVHDSDCVNGNHDNREQAGEGWTHLVFIYVGTHT